MTEMTEFGHCLPRLNIEGTRDIWKKNREKIDFILNQSQRYINEALTACDIGIGDGYLLTRLQAAGLEVTGIDISGYLVEYHKNDFKKKGLNIRLIQGDISNLSLEDNQFDIVTCLDVLEHIPGDGLRAALENLKKCIKNDGFLIITLPLGENLENNMVICPECGHKFHRIGHFHSFENIMQVIELLSPEFKIIKTGEVPFNLFPSEILNIISFFLYKFLLRLFHRENVTTAYFITRLVKS